MNAKFFKFPATFHVRPPSPGREMTPPTKLSIRSRGSRTAERRGSAWGRLPAMMCISHCRRTGNKLLELTGDSCGLNGIDEVFNGAWWGKSSERGRSRSRGKQRIDGQRANCRVLRRLLRASASKRDGVLLMKIISVSQPLSIRHATERTSCFVLKKKKN